MDWLENEGNDDGATQKIQINVHLLRKKIFETTTINANDDEGEIARAKKRLTNPTPSLTEEELKNWKKKRKRGRVGKERTNWSWNFYDTNPSRENAPPLLTSAEAVSAGFKVVSVTDPKDVTKRVYLKVEEYPLGQLDGDANGENDVLLSENQLSAKERKEGYDHARATINRIHLLNEPINDMLMEIEEKKSAALAARLTEQANRENTMPTEEEMLAQKKKR